MPPPSINHWRKNNLYEISFFSLLKSTNRGPVSFTQGEPADKHIKTSQLAPPPPQYLTVNIYFQQ